MIHQIRAHMQFDFRGRTHALTVCIDLERWMHQGGSFDAVELLADANGIDRYSYEFEVMQQSEVHFDVPDGAGGDDVRAFLHAGGFDADGFARWWGSQRLEAVLVALLPHSLDAAQRPSVLDALRHAYQLGAQSAGVAAVQVGQEHCQQPEQGQE